MKIDDIDALSKYTEDQEEESVDVAKLFFKYLRYWKWFLLSMVVCIAVAALYLKLVHPVYEVDAKILLKDDKKGSSSDIDNNMSAFQDLGLFSAKNNADNELEILKTSYLMEQAVRKLGIYAQYTETGSFRNRELYGKDCPISVSLPEAVLDTLHGAVNFEIEVQPNGRYIFTKHFCGFQEIILL